ncbi:negative regulator of sigma-B (phosphoserine phosphatase) [Geomicrobium halophilum]|uniref:Negative regulator of sigma-B (Phosphoserine phosphatase) n=1 Tax=Geomicrobium halophilum TaxID=549000 RepID=A0A841Q2S0_9BACL|nr:SpoIIE family protein phosphatase [Geomicrobium halophilum]MBB6451278.1 negative regulator of sigma-B (phosphoserine phosphatase) [Geomicrobium halophilum]
MMMNIIEEQYLKVRTAAYQKEKQGCTVCGDAYYMVETDDYFLLALADGLGSGEMAKRSSRAAMHTIEHLNESAAIEEVFSACNQALFNERGVVMTLLKIDYRTRKIFYGNVGNVECYLNIDNERCYHPITSYGFISGRRVSPKVDHYHFDSEMSFVLYTDGARCQGMKENFVRHAHSPKVFLEKMVENDTSGKDDYTIITGHINK